MAMSNWSGKNCLVCWTIFGLFTLGKIAIQIFHKCAYEELNQKQKWLETVSPLFLALNVVKTKIFLMDIKYLSKFCYTVWSYSTKQLIKTPPPPPEASRNNNNVSVCFSRCWTVPSQGKSKEFNNQGMKA